MLEVPMVAGTDENPLVVLMLEVPMVAGTDENPLVVLIKYFNLSFFT